MKDEKENSEDGSANGMPSSSFTMGVFDRWCCSNRESLLLVSSGGSEKNGTRVFVTTEELADV